MKLIYEIFRWFGLLTGWPVQLVWFTRKTYYEDRRTQGRFIRGGALIISNHYNVLDYIVNVFLVAFRKLYVIYAKTSSKWAILGMNFFGGIPVDRSSYHMPFLDETIRLLKKGRLVQIYPEAHITRDGNMLPFKPSYIYIAHRAGVPIIPVIIDGNYGLLKRAHVIVGTPIDLKKYNLGDHPNHDRIREINEEVQRKCHALKAELDARVKRDRSRRWWKKRRKEQNR